MLNEVANNIWNENKFHKEYTTIIQQSITRSIIGNGYEYQIGEDVLTRLLESAAILSQSERVEHREAAYRISVSAYGLYGNAYDCVAKIVFIVLSRLGNFPAIKYTLKTENETPDDIPLMILLEALSRRSENEVTLSKQDSSRLVLTDFQKDIWDILHSGVSLGTSAPTSAGKSYVLQAFIRRLWKTGSKLKVVYIVPTRALINQVSIELQTALKADGFADPEIVTVPVLGDEEFQSKRLFVLTQERLQLLLTTYKALNFDFVIVDEAQAVGDGSRGVILSSVLEEIQRRNKNIQMFFASPNVTNPNIFERLFRLDNFQFKRNQDITVSQNLIHLDTSNIDLRKVTAYLNLSGQKLKLCDLTVSEDVTTPRTATLHLSNLIGQGGQSLIYAKGASDCQELAIGLMQLQLDSENFPEQKKKALKELSDFIKESVHSKYVLAEAVLKGVGFHYGAMPPLVRRAIEDEFRAGNLKYLICTSTLLHGLNLPAKNLFLNKPEKGNNQPIESVDFWNLAGRAGRLGKEFEGNVFLIDYDSWGSKPLEGVKETTINSTLDKHVVRYKELVDYIRDPERAPEYTGRDEFENTFTKFFFDFRKGNIDNSLQRLNVNVDSNVGVEIKEALGFASQYITLPDEVTQNSPTVSLYRQQRLYEYMIKRISEKGPEYLMPAHPLKAGASMNLSIIFKRCHNQIFQWKSSDRRHLRAAVFALPWMQGKPLPEIIDNHFKFATKTNKNHTISKSIIETLDAIEDDIRFTYVKLTGCYNNLLGYALQTLGFNNLSEKIVPLPLYLEVGACSQTMISFMEMGLSRITARKLADKAYSGSFSTQQAKMWLKQINLEQFGFSPLIIQEIKHLV